MIYFLSFVFVISVLIFVHEFGHFVFAKKYNIPVTKFSIGFGPKIFGFTRGETEYRLSAIPLGGYVSMVGEQPNSKVPPELEHRSFRSKPPHVKFLVAFAGPAFNAIFAFLVMWIAFMVGAPMISSKIGSVVPGSPAARANLAANDMIVRIDGGEVSTWQEVTRHVRSSGELKPIKVDILRNGKKYRATVVPEVSDVTSMFGEKTKGRQIGIFSSGDREIFRKGIIAAAQESVRFCAEGVMLVAKAVVMLVKRTLPLESLGGPLKIATVTGSAAKSGVMPLIAMMAMLSINVGVMNLIPIPVLDGGHMMFSAVEALRGKPVGLKVHNYANWFGVVVLVTLTVTVIYNDLVSVVKSYAKNKTPAAVSEPSRNNR